MTCRRVLARSLAAWLVVVALAVPPALAQTNQGGAPDALSARAFEVHYRNLTDAAELIGAALSERGTVTLRPRLRTIVVEDTPAVLDRVAALLESFDLPPRQVEVTMSLFLGQRDDEAAEKGGAPHPGALSREIRGISEVLPQFTKWTSYELLGSRSVTGIEGDPVVAEVSGDYRVKFTVESVNERQGVVRVKFDRFSLQREVLLGDGGRDIEDLYTAAMVVEARKLTLVVAASAPDSKRALFLALQVDPR